MSYIIKKTVKIDHDRTVRKSDRIFDFIVLFLYNCLIIKNASSILKKHKEIIAKAKKHAKKNYRDKITSMAAVLLSSKGNMYTGINVKYKNIWKCICAERVAIAKAAEAGEMEFDTIVTVKYFPETDSYEVMNMCGECRQIAICHQPFSVIVNDKKIIKLKQIEDVFPYPYN